MGGEPKILQLCLSDGLGGLELYVFRTVQQLLKRAHHCVTVVRADTMLSSRMDECNADYYVLTKLSKLFPFIAARRLARIIDQEQVDIVHMHWAKDLNLAVLAKQFAKRPIKLIYTRQMMITRSKHDLFHRWLYRHVDRILTITDELRELMVKFLPMPAENIERLYYGVDAPPEMSTEQRTYLRKKYGFSEDDFVIFMVGRIEECKGQHLLIEAMERLHQQGIVVCALFVGPAMDDGYLQGLKDRVQNSALAGTVKFAGPHKSPSHMAASFEVALLATECETFGLVLIEAMRAGIPVIGTAACGVLEIIDEAQNGLLFPPNDSQALAGAIRRLYEDPGLRQRLAKAGADKADEMFATEHHYDELEVVYNRLISNSPHN
ncbi:MAG: glycosyltransferase family 4 protein [Pseudomonadota bacterium]